jgi:ABC-2 type transport system ATP-binding protein
MPIVSNFSHCGNHRSSLLCCVNLMTNPDTILSVAALAKRFAGGNGIHDVSFSVPKGSVTGFIGANGAGKSTTLRCIVGVMRPDAGEIRLFDEPWSKSARARIGFLPEERGLFGHERAREAIAFHGALKGMPRRDALAAADHLLQRAGLSGRESDRIGSLSKGNAQRVQVLCALVHRPGLLLLDEPLSGLDPTAQADMLSLLAEFRAEGGAILFSTHSMAAAEGFCDRIVMLADGRTVFEGSLAEASKAAARGVIVITTSDGAGLRAAVSAVGGQVRPLPAVVGDVPRWRVLVPPHIGDEALARALANRGVSIEAIQADKADLETAFWNLATPATRKVKREVA